MAAAVLFAVVSNAAAEPAVVDRKVNLRSGPGPAFGVIALLPAGAKLDVLKCGNEWCRVRFGRQVGYASAAYLKTGGDSYASAAPAPPRAEPPASKPTLTGPRIWQWRDDDWRDEHWRRLEWHNRLSHR
jgi:uncharacterized protein YraI